MNLQILRSRALGSLKENLNRDFSRYSDPGDPVVSGNDFIDSTLVVGDAPILVENGYDAENARAVHSWLHRLDPVQASDERLWAALSIGLYRNYTVTRWNPTKKSTVKSRFFYSGTGLDTAVRNSISRLFLDLTSCSSSASWRSSSNANSSLSRISLIGLRS